jgi:DNA polymerase-3 subunit delta
MDAIYRQFMSQAREGEIKHAYMLLGENQYLKQRLLDNIQEKIVEPRFATTDRLLVYGDGVQPDVISWLNSPPFGSKRKLLVIKDADLMPPKIRAEIQKWVDKPSKTSVLVMMAEKGGIKNVPTCKCWKLFEKEIGGWILSFVKEREFGMEREAVGFLQQVFGTDIQILAVEIEKLMSFVEPRRMIGFKDAQEMVSKEVSGSIYDLAHAVANRDSVKAQSLLDFLFELGEQRSSILWRISDHMDKLFKLKSDSGESLGIHKYYLPKYKRQAESWSESELLDAFSCMFETDLAVKTGKGKPDFLLRELIYKLCGTQKQA